MNKIFNKFLIGFLFLLGVVLILPHKADAVIDVGVTATPSSVLVGERSWIEWTSSGADYCNGDGPTTGGYWTEYFTEPGDYTYTVECTKADPVVQCNSYYTDLVTCFTADTLVIMSNGTTKDIQDVKIGDVLKGETTNNKVLGFHQPKLDEKKLYSFNGGRYFVTAEHPFKTIDGWKSINPTLTAEENIGITVTELKVGDTLITENGNILLQTINSKNDKVDTQLYDFLLDGDHTYYADGYLVHNKTACSSDYSCVSGQVCLPDSSSYCSGTVIGSEDEYGYEPGPYEGYDCDYFDEWSCEQGWITHGCHWVAGSYTCASCPGSCPSGYTASCAGSSTLCTENTPCSGMPVN